jgi:thioester reductase-like protein
MDVKIEDGEIVVKGPGVMLGYYKNPEATAEAFTEDGYLRTGDLGYLDEDGYLYITGRSKNLIILDNGKNVYPEELESHLLTIEGVKDVMVYESNGKIAAAVQPVDIHDKTVQKNIKLKVKEINNNLPSYKRVVTINFVARDFPKTTTMKIKRKEAMQMLDQVMEKKKVPYVAPKTEEQTKIVAAFESVLGIHGVGIKEDFFDLGGDSLATFEVAAILGIQAQEIYENPTAELLGNALQASRREEERESGAEDINAVITHKANIRYEHAGTCVLLTGATGFLGSHVLRELVSKDIKVYCLVRNKERLGNVLHYYFPQGYKSFRYTPVLGDITQPRFGLSDEEYAQLVQDVNMVIHTAANVNHAGHYEDLELTNVIGTQNVIDFCKEADAVLQHTSTASVNGSGTVEQTNPNVLFDEFVLDIGQNYYQNVYIHSKYRAEELVLLARRDGLKANIFRIGNLTWRMSDGKFQKNAQDNGFLDRFRGLLKVGMYSQELAEYPIDFTPVDECADAYVRLAFHNRVNNIYNLYNPYLFSVDMLVKRFFWGVKKVSPKTFEKALKDMINDKEVAVLSFYNTIASASKNISTSNLFTVKQLKKLGFRWSRIGIRYLSYAKKI